MRRGYGGQSMVAQLRRVLVRRPDESFAVDDPAQWHYADRPNLARGREEHAALVDILRAAGAEVIFHDAPQPGRADAIFVYDPALMTDHGAVILRMGKQLRRGEEAALARCLEALDVPVIATLDGDASAESGDMMWLDHETLVVGQGFRTNAAGLRQLRAALEPLGITIIPFDLPYYTGPAACLHLLSLISPVDHDLAVVYAPLLAVPFWQELHRRGFQLIEVAEAEFATLGPNVLALAPRVCLVLEGNPITRRRLEAAGCTVLTYRGDELSLKAEGGPTCLTLPLLRA